MTSAGDWGGLAVGARESPRMARLRGVRPLSQDLILDGKSCCTRDALAIIYDVTAPGGT